MKDQVINQKAKKEAVAHVDWFIKTIRPLLIEQFTHGYKHGRKDK